VLKVDHQAHGQTLADLRHQALHAPHPRTRERFLALYEIASGALNATEVARATQREDQTIHQWVRAYNERGPEALTNKRTGGSRPFDPARQLELVELVRDHPPGRPRNLTLRKLVIWLLDTHGLVVSRETVRRVLMRAGLTYKVATKVLTRACPIKRAEYLGKLAPLLDEAMRGKRILIFLDPAHIQQDCDLGRGWAPRGKRLMVASPSKQLSEKATFYGVYVYNQGSVRIWEYDRANAANTMEVVDRLHEEFPTQPVTLIWDNASYHRAKSVRRKVAQLGWQLEFLPGYSPDFMPVEELWRWLRSEVTAQRVHDTRDELIESVARFTSTINALPYAIADRLVVRDHVDHETEELRFSA